MAKQFFYRIKISTAIKHMSCKCMPQNVRAFLFNCGYHSKIAIYCIINILIIQLVSLICNKKPAIIFGPNTLTPDLHIFFQSFNKRLNQWDDPLFISFPGYFNSTFRQIQVVISQSYQLRSSHPCKIKKLNYSTVLYACLLYTSPSPRDGLLSRMPSS